MKRVLPFLFIFLLLFGLFACEENKADLSERTFTVSFRTTSLPYTVAEPSPVTLKEGDLLTEPSLSVEPSAGYVRIWTLSPTSVAPYDFSAPVTSSFILYAREVPKSYTVTYLIEHGTNNRNNPQSFTKESGDLSLLRPTMDFGYRFTHWSYFDDEDSEVSSIASGTEHDVILRAHVEPISYTVRYAESGDTNPNPSEYLFGETLTLQDPSWEGYAFRGYTIYMDRENTPVTVLTPEFVIEYKAALFKGNGSDIFLQTNWEVAS